MDDIKAFLAKEPDSSTRRALNHNAHHGPRADIGPMEFRSSWEANFARILNHLNVKWKFEPHRFWLTGTISYLPDFELLGPNPWNAKWIEIKGLWNRGDKKKIRLFVQLNPKESIHVIAQKEYRALAKQYKPLIKNWECSVSRKSKRRRK
jgi:hypothetical protein